MTFKKTLPILLAMCLITLIGFSGCSSSGNSDGGNLTIKMTDAPANYEEVNITVDSIMIHQEEAEMDNENGDDEDTNKWITLLDEPITINLLNYSNRSITLSNTDLEAGEYDQIRLVLGSDNNVVINGETHPLVTPSGQQSGLKLNIDADIEEGEEETILIDFDAGQSIVVTGAGKYLLKPVLREVEDEDGGEIEGTVKPSDFRTYVMVVGNGDTLSTYTDADDGDFSVEGLAAGMYDVTFQPSDSTYADTTISGVDVTFGEETELDTVTLVKISN